MLRKQTSDSTRGSACGFKPLLLAYGAFFLMVQFWLLSDIMLLEVTVCKEGMRLLFSSSTFVLISWLHWNAWLNEFPLRISALSQPWAMNFAKYVETPCWKIVVTWRIADVMKIFAKVVFKRYWKERAASIAAKIWTLWKLCHAISVTWLWSQSLGISALRWTARWKNGLTTIVAKVKLSWIDLFFPLCKSIWRYRTG